MCSFCRGKRGEWCEKITAIASLLVVSTILHAGQKANQIYRQTSCGNHHDLFCSWEISSGPWDRWQKEVKCSGKGTELEESREKKRVGSNIAVLEISNFWGWDFFFGERGKILWQKWFEDKSCSGASQFFSKWWTFLEDSKNSTDRSDGVVFLESSKSWQYYLWRGFLGQQPRAVQDMVGKSFVTEVQCPRWKIQTLWSFLVPVSAVEDSTSEKVDIICLSFGGLDRKNHGGYNVRELLVEEPLCSLFGNNLHLGGSCHYFGVTCFASPTSWKIKASAYRRLLQNSDNLWMIMDGQIDERVHMLFCSGFFLSLVDEELCYPYWFLREGNSYAGTITSGIQDCGASWCYFQDCETMWFFLQGRDEAIEERNFREGEKLRKRISWHVQRGPSILCCGGESDLHLVVRKLIKIQSLGRKVNCFKRAMKKVDLADYYIGFVWSGWWKEEDDFVVVEKRSICAGTWLWLSLSSMVVLNEDFLSWGRRTSFWWARSRWKRTQESRRWKFRKRDVDVLIRGQMVVVASVNVW